MKRFLFLSGLAFGLMLIVGLAGCNKSPKGPTPIPGRLGGGPAGGTPFPPETTQPIPGGPGAAGQPIPMPSLEQFEGMAMDREIFAPNTVYFDFDRSAIKSSERPKIELVASHLKGNASNKLLIEGHCDERGTEEYNRALGERRALSVREYLFNLGISPERIRTISYGEDRPALPGQNEEAWSKNRRGEFVLLKP